MFSIFVNRSLDSIYYIPHIVRFGEQVETEDKVNQMDRNELLPFVEHETNAGISLDSSCWSTGDHSLRTTGCSFSVSVRGDIGPERRCVLYIDGPSVTHFL